MWQAAVAVIVAAAAGCARSPASRPANDPRADQVQAAFVRRLDSLGAATTALWKTTERASPDAPNRDSIQHAFARARIAYKRVEFLVGYFMPMVTQELNGPPIDEVDLDEGPTIIEPARGFQVLEGLIHPDVDTAQLPLIRREAEVVAQTAERARTLGRATVLRDESVFDAMRIELARVEVLGVTGFDSPVRHASLEESRAAVEGLLDGIAPYMTELRTAAPTVAATVAALLTAADARLEHSDFDQFDRLGFIASVANPLARALVSARDALKIAVPGDVRFWRAKAATLFDADAFDADVLRPVWAPPTTAERSALGRQLFFDPVLSGAGNRSCASCHDPDRAFTDGLAGSGSLTGRKLRNAPTLVNAALQAAQFADLRAVFLEDQVAAVVQSESEMHGVLDDAARRIRATPAYATPFRAAFTGPDDSVFTGATIRTALAAYIRSLNRLDSRVDRALRGDTAALTAEERAGFNLFAGKAICATCHFLPLTNGTAPPYFRKADHEVIGVPAAPVWRNARVDIDSGRVHVTRAELHRFAFKTPTIRNVALTAPYMHNGVYRTLEEVVRFYEGGGGGGIGIDLPNQTLPFDRLNLSDIEQRALVSFMRALTDTARTTGRGATITARR